MAFTPRYAPDLSSISWNFEWLDGDYKKVEMVDTTPDGGISINNFITYHFISGRPVKPDHMPTKLYPTIKRKYFPDFSRIGGGGLLLVTSFDPLSSLLSLTRINFSLSKSSVKTKKRIMSICLL